MHSQKSYKNYVNSYLKESVGSRVDPSEVFIFEFFMTLCAESIGELFDQEEVATICGIDENKANAWIKILESTHIIFFLTPYKHPFESLRTDKPKVYFYDTGFAT